MMRLDVVSDCTGEAVATVAAYNEAWRQSGSPYRQRFTAPPGNRPRPPRLSAPSSTRLPSIVASKPFSATSRPIDPVKTLDLIRKAWEFCVQHHKGQMRASGEPYIIHPLEVAEVLAEMKMDATAIAAGLLHDAVEDTPATSEEIEADFGDQVAHIVEGVTKIDKIQFANREDRQAENVRKMLLAMVSDVRVVLIKLADRLHNMRTLEHLQPDRQRSDCARDAGHLCAAGAPARAWAKCAANWKTWLSAIPIPSASSKSPRPSKRGASRASSSCAALRTRSTSSCGKTTSMRALSGASSALLHLPED